MELKKTLIIHQPLGELAVLFGARLTLTRSRHFDGVLDGLV
jgi:hypothetical protein